MNYNCFCICNLSLFFLIYYAGSVNGQVHYYITPSPSVPCPGDHCLTLPQFAANSTSYLSNISLRVSFLPGNHSLNGEFSLSHADNVSMTKVIGGNESVFVECGSQSGRFNISEIRFALIKNLHFIGCGGNRVSKVEQFKVQDAIFEGVEGRGTALVLNEVINAIITRSSFLSNTRDTTFLLQNNIESNIIATLSYALDRSSPIVAGGALYMVFSNVLIVNSKFTDNTAEIGGALFVHSSNLHVVDSSFCYNGAGDTINDIIIPQHYLHHSGGVMFISDSLCTITNSTFANNAAVNGGVMFLAGYKFFSIMNSTFTNNSATASGGIMYVSGYKAGSSFNIINSTFSNNNAAIFGGIIFTESDDSFNIISSIFASNSAAAGGVVCIFRWESSFNIISSTFSNNSGVPFDGGVMLIVGSSSINITNSNFTYNSATNTGGVIWASQSSFNIDRSNFLANKADNSGGIMFMTECSMHITDCKFNHNSGSLYIFNSNLNFSGYISFENCEEPSKTIATLNTLETVVGNLTVQTQPHPEGGAITSFQSTVIFIGVTYISNNQAKRGGAILAIESKFMIHGETIVANNIATDSTGGGISLQQSDLEIKESTTISGNDAVRGGGIHATSSNIVLHQSPDYYYQPRILKFNNNRAENGSGLYLESGAKLYVFKLTATFKSEHLLILFQDNHASYGGAIYVDDDTNSGACSPDNECFIQTLALYHLQQMDPALPVPSVNNLLYCGNTASEQGANIFGGLLDRCIPNPFAEVYQQVAPPYYSGVNYLGNISNLTSLDTISSLPVRICFCKSDSEPDCSYQPPTIKVRKGEAFTVPLVAVDQVNHSVEANIISSLSSQDGGFGDGQQI